MTKYDTWTPGAINQMPAEDLRREPTLSFKPLAEALVEFRKVLVDGGVEESHALLMTRDLLSKVGPQPPTWNYTAGDFRRLMEGKW